MDPPGSEVSAPVLSAQRIEVVFASVGAHDLAEDVLAAGHQLSALAGFNGFRLPGLVRVVRLAAEGARADGNTPGLCGEVVVGAVPGTATVT